jgi:hypothetical protein
MQTLWSRTLTEEAKFKGSFSLRTLKLLSTLNKEEANLITYFGKYVWQASNLTPILTHDINGGTDGITFSQLALLDSLGVIQQGFGYNLTFMQNSHIHYYGIPVNVEFKNDEPSTWSFSTGQALLSPIGSELMKICGSTPDFDYLKKTIDKINSEQNQVKLTIVTKTRPGIRPNFHQP